MARGAIAAKRRERRTTRQNVDSPENTPIAWAVPAPERNAFGIERTGDVMSSVLGRTAEGVT
jgi:hypothetical protein